jgi:hypothetical protein
MAIYSHVTGRIVCSHVFLLIIPPVLNFSSPSLVGDLDIKLRIIIMKLWTEQFHRIDMQQKEKEESGKYLDENWIKSKERPLMK